MSFFSAAIQALVEPSRRLGRPSLPRRLLDVIVPTQVAGRRAWAAQGRAAIEVPGIELPGTEGFASRLEEALERHPAVQWAGVNAPLGRVIIGLSMEPAPLEELVGIVRAVENRFGPGVRQGGTPVDPAPAERAAVELAAEVAGLAAALAVRLLRVPPVAAELAAGVSIVDSTPRLRGYVERALGQPRADTAIALASATVQALSQGFAGLAVDAAMRGLILREAGAEAACRRAAAYKYSATKDGASAEAPGPGHAQRAGPIERWGDWAGALGLSVFGVGLAGTGSPWQAAGVAVATLPKPGRVGREAFAAQLGTALSLRGAVVVDPEALRRLDRVDTVVLDADVFVTARYVMVSSVPLHGSDPRQVAEKLHALFRSDDPAAVQRDGAWTLGPVEELTVVGRRGVRERHRIESEAAMVLGLTHGTRLIAVAGVAAEPHQYLDAVAAACRRCGCRVVVAGDPGHLGPLGGMADEVGAGGLALPGLIRSFRETGSTLMLLSANTQALSEADIGIGIGSAPEIPVWGGDILVSEELELAPMLIEACNIAAGVSRDSTRLAQAGTVVGAVAAMMGAPSAGASRSMLAVNAASAVSLVLGVRAAVQLARRPVVPGISSVPWHAMPPEAVLEHLASSRDGLTAEQVRARQAQGGVSGTAPVSFLGAAAEELANPLTPVLGAGASLSAAIGAVVDGVLIAAVAVLSGVIGGIERLRTDRALKVLVGGSAVVAGVHRNGTASEVVASQLVPGDIVDLGAGDVVPADCRVIETAGLEADESSLTGEAFPVSKDAAAVIADLPAERTSMLYEGTTVASGRAVAVVVATGVATEAGRSAAASREGAGTSGVEKRLAAITKVTVPLTISSALAVVTAGLARGKSLRSTAGAGLSLAVAAVPEGLPFLVSAAQLAAARRLSAHGVLVRNPRTIEALGRVNVLCFDKTGTLTRGRIVLEAVSNPGEEPVPVRTLGAEGRRVLAAALRATPEKPPGRKLEHFTDRAVTNGAKEAGVSRGVREASWRRHGALAFEPARGYHAAAGSAAGQALLSVKGAPETVLPLCTGILRHGRVLPLDSKETRRIGHQIDRLTGRGYRVLAVAERQAANKDTDSGVLDREDVQDLTLLGFLALNDPVRSAAAPSLGTLRAAGVQIIMITGDHPGTAKAVAERLRLLNGGQVLTGAQMDALSDDDLDRVLPSVAVIARGTPAHKVRAVQAFQRLDRTVAMTGDGANDAPAIRLADVGIALGRRGTPAARAAADLVVTDDRLETIITALVEGRSMWASVREALGILVGGNLGEIAFTVLGAALSGLSPLGARQLLLVNLLTDLAPALAIALRPPHAMSAQALLAEGPEASLGSALVRDIGARALTTAVGAGAAWLAATALGFGPAAPTIALAGLIGTQLGQTLVSGTPTRGVIISGIGSVALLAAVIQNPVLSAFFGSVPLGLAGWALAATAGAAAVALSLLLPRISSYFVRAAGSKGAESGSYVSRAFHGLIPA
ncbi:cation-translocating P-type ATPase [Arthrobacter bambusae]|uniref:cation-translocating P-type ATPase n=1 Tax=Arthrobacter bambusae TaxID=1338426 RepID=UPI002787C4BB|nr:HAD-IC family P-type ATPase [Arthrobacter bambusae]MDQ0028597.1 magnesium-transporting ATPase (P-type) [Arthrobacter bambusae]MDQ0096609.1 magnesium-transporting ATPase (P-type) [Arthrobacter bambusae]